MPNSVCNWNSCQKGALSYSQINKGFATYLLTYIHIFNTKNLLLIFTSFGTPLPHSQVYHYFTATYPIPPEHSCATLR